MSRITHVRILGSMALLATLALATFATGCRRASAASPDTNKRVIILGFDGMDWGLVTKMMAAGKLPNFSRLASQGIGQALGTSTPPLSPVAWSTFTTGMDDGGDGVFDFINRDPKTMTPYLSISRAEASSEGFNIGKYHIPLGSGKVELLRRGIPFWQVLRQHGIHTTVMRMPADYPPTDTANQELSGMGTPDILGTYGTFSFYNSDPFAEDRDVEGGHLYPLDYEDYVATGALYGPDNPFLKKKTPLKATFKLYVDPAKPVAMLELGDQRRVLQAGEWSSWVPFEFDMIPTQHLPVEVRFYLRQVTPEIELYASPINIDPMSPAQPISNPPGFAKFLAEHTGRFYTQGMPEDTKAITDGVFNMDEFLAQAHITNMENEKQYWFLLKRFKTGLLFNYFGDTDLVSHIVWRSMDPTHPAYDAKTDAKYADVIPHLYEWADGVVGKTLDRMGPNTLLVVMSDHGFTSWKRAFNLNTWLEKEGYLVLNGPPVGGKSGIYWNVDWSRTRAYGLGFNGLYINLAGREKDGIVPPSDKMALEREIQNKLTHFIDPKTGKPAVDRLFISSEYFHYKRYLSVGPDMIVGYAHGTRCSDASVLGEVTDKIVEDNLSRWSADHSMDPVTIPGILFASQRLPKKVTNLDNLAAAVLAEFGIEHFPPASEAPSLSTKVASKEN